MARSAWTSELGAGSTFWFELPLPLGSARIRLADVAEPRPAERPARSGRRRQRDQSQHPRGAAGLLADDAGPGRQRRLGPRSAAGDGRSAGQPYDLAVLDMFMPDMDGLQLARAISADPLLQGTPMIMLTSSMQLEPAVLRAGRRRAVAHQADAQLGAVRPADAPDGRHGGGSTSSGRVSDRSDHPHTVSLGKILVVEDNSLNQLVAEGVAVPTRVRGRTASPTGPRPWTRSSNRLFRRPDGLPHAA